MANQPGYESDREVRVENSMMLRDPDLRRYLLARIVSVGGSALTYVALPVLVYSLTRSPAWTAAVTVAEALPYLVFGLWAGALADRLDRKRVMVIADLLAAATLSSVPLAWWFAELHPLHVLAAGLVSQAAFVFFDAANFGALPTLVGRERLPAANSLLYGSSTVAETLVPPATGLALVLVAPAPLLVLDVVSFLASALLIRGITRSLSAVRGERAPLLGDIRQGLGFVVKHPVVRVMTLVGSMLSFGGGAFMAVFLVWADRELGVREGDWRLSALYAGWGVGGVAGSVLMPRVVRRFGAPRTTILGLPMAALACGATVLAPTWWSAVLGLLGWGVAYMVVVTNAITVRQQVTPEPLMSRVSATGRLLAFAVGYPLGAVTAGVLAGPFGVVAAMLAGVAMMGAAGVVAWLSVLRTISPVLVQAE